MTVVVELSLPAGTFPFESALAPDREATLRVERVVPFGSTTLVVRVHGPDHREVASSLRSAAAVTRSEVVEELDDSTLVHVECGDWTEGLFQAIVDSGGTILDVVGDDDWRIQARFPDRESLSSFYDARQSADDAVDLRRIDTEATVGPTGDVDLSEPQAEALVTAFRQGYFEVPREAGVDDIGADLGISEQAVSERLRRGIARLAEQTVLEDETGS